MDGVTVLFIQVPVTIITIGIGFWKVHDKLRDKIDETTKEATEAKNAAQNLAGICKAHRESFDRRVTRLEARDNSRK
jgi:hypothetical protein